MVRYIHRLKTIINRRWSGFRHHHHRSRELGKREPEAVLVCVCVDHQMEMNAAGEKLSGHLVTLTVVGIPGVFLPNAQFILKHFSAIPLV